jgi:hypothetical protein
VIHFALAFGAPGTCHDHDGALARAVADTAIFGGEQVVVSSPSGAWHVAAVATADPFLSVRWYTDGEAVVLCNGMVTSSSRVDLASVLQRYRDGGPAAAEEGLTGTASLVCVAPERGLAAIGGPAGFFTLYHGAADDHVVVSNRSTTVARALGESRYDPHPLGWLIGVGHVCGDAVPAHGVRSLPIDHVGGVPWGGRSMVVERRPGPQLPGPGDDDRPTLSSAEWDAVTDELVAEVRNLAALDVPLHLPITGGKDSRLLLSLVVAAGVTGVETYTSGGPDSAEVASAAAVAAAAGVEHRRGAPPEARGSVTARVVGGPDTGELDGVWRRVARGAGRFEGIAPTWAAIKSPTAAGGIFLKGWGGELYRYKTRPLPLDAAEGALGDVDRLTAAIGDRFDPLGVLSAPERERQRAWLRTWVQCTVDEHRSDLVPDLFYADQTLRNVHGPVTQGVPLRLVANPLVSRAVIRAHAALSLRARSVDRLHYEVMRRAAPALVSLPFFEQVWPPEIRAGSTQQLPDRPFGTVGAARPPLRRPPPLPGEAGARVRSATRPLARRARVDWLAGSRWSSPRPGGHETAWALVEREPHAVTALFRSAADEGLSSICRVERLCRLVERPGRFTRTEELQITNAIGAAMLLLGRTERVIETLA